MTWKLLRKLTIIAFFTAMIPFVSCDKDDAGDMQNTGTVSFSAVVNDIISNRVAAPGEDLPNCSDADPAYVDVVVTGPRNMGSVAAPYRVDLINNGGVWETDENEEMTNVPAGEYQLIYFIVYDAENNPIWIAPTAGNYEDFVPEPLPLDFTVEAAVNNVVSVDVLCFKDRILNEFGGLVFTLDPYYAIEFCILGNTCGAGDANFSASVWLGSDNSGSILYMDYANVDGGALCMALPDLEGEDQYYFELTMNAEVIRSGAITDADVKSLHDGETNINPYIFYEGDGCVAADSPDLFANGGGGDPGNTEGTVIEYAETFESIAALADINYDNVLINQSSDIGSTIGYNNGAGNYADLNDVALTSDNGMQLFYRADDDTQDGTLDNAVITPVFETTGGTYNVSYDVSYVTGVARNAASIAFYWSDSYTGDGNWNESDWNELESISAADLDTELGSSARTVWFRRPFEINPTGDFYLAIRINGELVFGTDFDRTQWRFDNIQVTGGSIGGGSGGGETGGTFSDFTDTFEDFDATATYDPSYLEVNGYEIYQLNTFTTDQNIVFNAETNNNYPTLANHTISTTDATGSDGSGIDMSYFAETAADPLEWAYGTFDAALVSPGQADANGDFTINIDARRFFGNETDGTVSYYWSNSYTPGGGFNPSDWTLLESESANGINESGGFVRKSFNVTGSTGTIYFAVQVTGNVNDGGTPEAGDGLYRFRVRFDNLQITQN